MYTTESYTTYIAVSDYKKRYIDIPTFTEYCKAMCPIMTDSVLSFLHLRCGGFLESVSDTGSICGQNPL